MDDIDVSTLSTTRCCLLHIQQYSIGNNSAFVGLSQPHHQGSQTKIGRLLNDRLGEGWEKN